MGDNSAYMIEDEEIIRLNVVAVVGRMIEYTNKVKRFLNSFVE